MQMYKVTAKAAPALFPVGCRFAASMAEARVRRTELMEQFNLPKKFVHVEPVDVLTQKAELLGFINGLLKTYDKEPTQ